MKHFKHFLLAVLVALTSSLSASAYDFEVDGIYYRITSHEDLTCEVTCKQTYLQVYSSDIVIPSTVTYSGKTFSVASIGYGAFSQCTSLTSVTIPSSVTTIRGYAFNDCSSLTSITIPNSVTMIEGCAFKYCTSLASVEIPNSVTSIGEDAFENCSSLPVENKLRYADTYLVEAIDKTQNTYKIKEGTKWIGSCAFYKCSSLSSVEIPNSVTSIGNYAFTYCSSLTSVEIPNSITEIGRGAFSLCSRLISVEIPNSVTTIGDYAFNECSSLTSVEIPTSVTEIGQAAFSRCSSLESFSGKFTSEDHRCLVVDGVLKAFAPAGLTSYVTPHSVTSIGYCTFWYCSSLTSIVISNTVTLIGDGAFEGCSSLTSVEIPNSVTEIGSAAFNGCSCLTSVVIGSSVKLIRNNAFRKCTSLKEITCFAVTPPALEYDMFAGVSTKDIILKVPSKSVTAYQTANTWKNFENIIGLDKCADPTISLLNGKLNFETTTEGALVEYNITSDDFRNGLVDNNTLVPLIGQYLITAVAKAENYVPSETVTATLVWVNPTLEGSNIISMEAKKAVLISVQDGSIIVSGTEQGEGIQLYSTDGRQLRTVSANDGQTVIPCTASKGEIIIVKYGGKAVKVLM